MDLKEIKFNNFNIVIAFMKLYLFPGKIWINIHLQAFFLWLKKTGFIRSLLVKKLNIHSASKYQKINKFIFIYKRKSILNEILE